MNGGRGGTGSLGKKFKAVEKNFFFDLKIRFYLSERKQNKLVRLFVCLFGSSGDDDNDDDDMLVVTVGMMMIRTMMIFLFFL